MVPSFLPAFLPAIKPLMPSEFSLIRRKGDLVFYAATLSSRRAGHKAKCSFYYKVTRRGMSRPARPGLGCSSIDSARNLGHFSGLLWRPFNREVDHTDWPWSVRTGWHSIKGIFAQSNWAAGQWPAVCRTCKRVYEGLSYSIQNLTTDVCILYKWHVGPVFGRNRGKS